jgi:hypothetical protein
MSSLEPYNFKAKPAIYKGTQMRSGLEVTIARALDAIGLQWTYEPARYADNRDYYSPDFRVKIAVVGLDEVSPTGLYQKDDADIFVEAKYTMENETLRKQAVRRAQILEQSTDAPLIFVGLTELHASLAGWIISGDGRAVPGAITRRRKYEISGSTTVDQPCLYVGPMAEIWLDGFAAASIDELALPSYQDWR